MTHTAPSGKRRKIIRWCVRLVLLGLFVFLLIGGPLPDYAARIIPALSPLSVLSAALAHRAWYVSLAWSLPMLLLLALALWKGRFFCRWICPLGALYSIPSEHKVKRRFFPWRLNGVFFWFIVGASLAGLPLLLFLDPLSTFMRLGAMGQGAAHGMAWIPGALIPLMLLLSFLQPQIWCAQLCPLGYLFQKIKLRRPKKRENAPKPERKLNAGRREMLAGLALGVPFALLLKKTARAVEADLPVLPPGAKSLDDFAATCIRCYACVDVCMTSVLTVRKRGGVAELCLPELDYDHRDGAYCEQYCNACSQVCPTGAIRSLTLEDKQQRKIATASIIRESCLAWSDHKECLACDEFCPYNAFEIRTGKNGIPRPVVNQDLCRGCGACRNVCPAIRAGNAIRITPLTTQSVISENADSGAGEYGSGGGYHGGRY